MAAPRLLTRHNGFTSRLSSGTSCHRCFCSPRVWSACNRSARPRYSTQPATHKDITQINQELDLWRGILTSKFKLFGEPVSITTAVHPVQDLLAIVIDSRLTGLGVRIAFPYGSPSMQAADWNQPDKHETRIIADGKLIERQLDGDAYFVRVQGRLKIEGRHSPITLRCSVHSVFFRATASTRKRCVAHCVRRYSVGNGIRRGAGTIQ